MAATAAAATEAKRVLDPSSSITASGSQTMAPSEASTSAWAVQAVSPVSESVTLHSPSAQAAAGSAAASS